MEKKTGKTHENMEEEEIRLTQLDWSHFGLSCFLRAGSRLLSDLRATLWGLGP